MTSSKAPPTTTPTPTVYFGYGSNLWHHQMATRCPTSTYIGIARLRPYAWLINDRGYANVVEQDPKEPASTTRPKHSQSPSSKYATTVYGLVYTLLPSDESRLDVNEGVPVAYTKEYLSCDFWALDPDNPLNPSPPPPFASSTILSKIDTSAPPTSTFPMLVYIDRKRTSPSVPRKEYIYRMNRGIEDAVKCGVPEGYVDQIMRTYIPADDNEEDEERGKMAEFARGQAERFKDESGILE